MHDVVMQYVTAGQAADQSIWQAMFQFQVPPLEKVIRTVVVYAVIALLLRVAGKRQLAQLNTFDLVVALLLSNVVQNAIIGSDNSLVGGLLGAVVLIGTNAVIDRVCLASPGFDRVFNGTETTLVEDGLVDRHNLVKVGLSDHELLSALRRQGADSFAEIEQATISPGGAIVMELKRAEQNASTGELEAAVAELRRHIDERFTALEGHLGGGRG